MQPTVLEAARQLLAAFSGPPASEAEAPGRVNLIGEHTDYNGGLVLPAALSQRTAVVVRFAGGSRVRGVSREEGATESALGAPPARTWLDYVRGVAGELVRADRIPKGGFDVAVAGEVPGGSGLSSSAALEVATALALGAAAGRPFASDEALDLARLCQRAESGFVGVPCGILDPFASLLAREGQAILLDCALMDWEPVPLPSSLELLIVDTGVRRALREGGYKTRRDECEQALEAARGVLGREIQTLSEIDPRELPALRSTLPHVLYRRLRHVVTENRRVRAFVEALRAVDLPAAGEALYGSHASLRDDYEVTCAESDLLVDQSRMLIGVVGARMTGAGWGGCTVHLVESDRAQEVLESLQARFVARFDRIPRAWRTRPGPGARAAS
jgi:galactokinase